MISKAPQAFPRTEYLSRLAAVWNGAAEYRCAGRNQQLEDYLPYRLHRQIGLCPTRTRGFDKPRGRSVMILCVNFSSHAAPISECVCHA